MSREWRPGDVALVNYKNQPDEPWRLAFCCGGGVTGDAHFVLDNAVKVWSSVSEARPLVTIDPEDREQVERLCELYAAERNRGDRYLIVGGVPDAMQAALREFANPTPPKPPEPTGLGAVVEDAVGWRWVRASAFVTTWRYEDEDGDGQWRDYADIAVVRVLSDGWSE